MSVVTLTTDFAGSGYYLAALKGVVLRVFPETQLVEVSQNINPRDIGGAAFTIQKAFKYFPEKTIHIVHVHAADSAGRLLIAEFQQHIFLLFDNGIAPLIFEYNPVQYFEVNKANENGSLFFQTISTALESIKSDSFKNTPTTSFKKLQRLNPIGRSGNINGHILYIDKFGNAITNIHWDMWQQNIKSDFEISINGYKTSKLVRFYTDIEGNKEIGAFFNAENLLEIALRDASAEKLLGLRVNGVVMVMEY
ncbi:MAG TPA: SAM-dependent chlorinase/fluorinase [Arachidicoccus sp.]